MSAEIDEVLLRSVFEPIGPLFSLKIPPGKGCAFVQFVYPQSAEQAITSLNGANVSTDSVPSQCHSRVCTRWAVNV